MSQHVRVHSLLIFFLLTIFSSKAQENYGVRVSGVTPIVRTVDEILEIETRLPRRNPRRNKDEVSAPPRVMNPESPAVAMYSASNFNSPQGTMGVNMSTHSNFLATDISDGATQYYPPDCNGDISTANQIVVTTNGRIKVYNVPAVTGTALSTTTGSGSTALAGHVFTINSDALFSNTPLGISLATDPHVRFDRLSGRWFIVAQDKSHSANNYLMIAVSSGTTLTASTNFTIYYLLSTTGSSQPNADWMDYPTLGIDKHALYVGANVLTGPTGSSRGSSIMVINKASLIAGSLSATIWQYGTGAGKSGSTTSTWQGIMIPQGVQNDDPSATNGYFIGCDWAAFGKLIIKKVTNPGTATPTLSADISLTIPTNVLPIYQLASGTSNNLDPFDDRLFAAQIMKNKITGIESLWTSHTMEVNTSGVAATGGGRNASRWYEIRDLSTTPILYQSGTLFDPAASNPKGYWMSSIAMNGQGHAVIGSSVASSATKAQAGYASRYYSDVAGSLQAYTEVTTTTSNYNPAGGTTKRWGDYSQTVVDPKNNMTFWTFQEYASSTDEWGLEPYKSKHHHQHNPLLPLQHLPISAAQV